MERRPTNGTWWLSSSEFHVELDGSPLSSIICHPKAWNRCHQGEVNTLRGGDAKRVIEAKEALQKPHNSIASSQSITTPYASNSKEAGWYKEKEESSHLHYLEFESCSKRVPWSARSTGKTLIGTAYPPIETLMEFRNKNNYCEYREDYEHTTFECRELRKALHQLAD
ncbi:hypothetical protein Cgig2_018985 [Carnegiea gigantea]|uniref:Uncharacterized protein n=1 Tax=Carnegiea gigantea TaxID=171969 RepID=A0A9Q1GX15_9CARY|nr:hypothetical protein Cgig2_018985 [Carnegiea gigantea]